MNAAPYPLFRVRCRLHSLRSRRGAGLELAVQRRPWIAVRSGLLRAWDWRLWCPWEAHLTGCCLRPPHYCKIQGRAAELAWAAESPGWWAEHLFLGTLHDGGWPVCVISHLV